MHWQGVIIGLICFLVIGLSHPLVIKGVYYFGVKIWRAFLVAEIITPGCSLAVRNTFLSAASGVFSFSCFRSILEAFHQRIRVEKGWFPKRKR